MTTAVALTAAPRKRSDSTSPATAIAPGIETRVQLCAADGRSITRAFATFTPGPPGWHATLRRLEQPGALVAMYFSAGIRDAVIALPGGRLVRCVITAASFVDGERVCEVAADQPV